MHRWDLINTLLAERPAPTTYLEVGVWTGTNVRRIGADTRLGVDPDLRSRKLRYLSRLSPARVRVGHRRGLLPFSLSSDAFFARYAGLLEKVGIDVAFVDGLHTADQAYRDITNALGHLKPNGTVVVHDCNPQSASAAGPELDPAGWNGEVYKAMIRLRAERSDLRVAVLDADQGLGIVRFGTPESRVDLGWERIRTMSYEDFAADRVHLLNLRPAEAVTDYVDGPI